MKKLHFFSRFTAKPLFRAGALCALAACACPMLAQAQSVRDAFFPPKAASQGGSSVEPAPAAAQGPSIAVSPQAPVYAPPPAKAQYMGINPSETEARAKRTYDRLVQKFGDGPLSQKIGNSLERLSAAQKEFRIVICMDFVYKDRNNDSMLVFEEYAEPQLKDWALADPAKKGVVDKAQYEAYYSPKVEQAVRENPGSEKMIRKYAKINIERSFNFLDANHDGYLTRQEFLKRMVDGFALLDKNRDGAVDLNEYSNGLVSNGDMEQALAEAKERVAIERKADEEAERKEREKAAAAKPESPKP